MNTNSSFNLRVNEVRSFAPHGGINTDGLFSPSFFYSDTITDAPFGAPESVDDTNPTSPETPVYEGGTF